MLGFSPLGSAAFSAFAQGLSSAATLTLSTAGIGSTNFPTTVNSTLNLSLSARTQFITATPTLGLSCTAVAVVQLATAVATLGASSGAKFALDFTTPGLFYGPNIAFTRNSSATYVNSAGVIVTATSGLPRFDYDPNTLLCKGLLIEEARTNYISHSALNTTSGSYQLTATLNNYVAPDGTTAAAKLTDNSVSGAHYIALTNLAGLVNTPWTFSYYVHDTSMGYCSVSILDAVTTTNYANATFNLSNATVPFTIVNGAATGLTTGITAVGGGWYRVWISATLASTADSGVIARIVMAINGTASGYSYSGTGSSIYVWGGQLEPATFPTSLIPTNGGNATRSAETTLISNIVPWFTAGPVTLVIEVLIPLIDVSSLTRMLSLDDGTTTNRLQFSGNNNTLTLWDTSAGTQISISQAIPFGTVFRAAAAADGTNVYLSVNGASVQSSANNYPLNPVQLSIGYETYGGTQINGYIRKIYYYNSALPPAQLLQLSTPQQSLNISGTFSNTNSASATPGLALSAIANLTASESVTARPGLTLSPYGIITISETITAAAALALSAQVTTSDTDPISTSTGTLSLSAHAVSSASESISGSGTLSLNINAASSASESISGSGTLSLNINAVSSASESISGSGTLSLGIAATSSDTEIETGNGTLVVSAAVNAAAIQLGTASGLLVLSSTAAVADTQALSGAATSTIQVAGFGSNTFVLSASGDLTVTTIATVSQTDSLTTAPILFPSIIAATGHSQTATATGELNLSVIASELATEQDIGVIALLLSATASVAQTIVVAATGDLRLLLVAAETTIDTTATTADIGLSCVAAAAHASFITAVATIALTTVAIVVNRQTLAASGALAFDVIAHINFVETGSIAETAHAADTVAVHHITTVQVAETFGTQGKTVIATVGETLNPVDNTNSQSRPEIPPIVALPRISGMMGGGTLGGRRQPETVIRVRVRTPDDIEETRQYTYKLRRPSVTALIESTPKRAAAPTVALHGINQVVFR